MSTLEELAARLSVLASRLGDHTRLEDRFERLTTSTLRLDAVARRLNAATEFLVAARADSLAGADEISRSSIGSVTEVLRAARTAATPGGSEEPDPLPLDRLERELEPVVQVVEMLARRVWRQYANTIVIQGEAELLGALARLPGLQAQVEALRGLQDTIRNLLTRDLPTAAQYQQLRAAAAQHAAQWAGLPISDNPEVIQFLRRAAAGGASLAELDRVRAWLDQHNLTAQFIVRPGAATR